MTNSCLHSKKTGFFFEKKLWLGLIILFLTIDSRSQLVTLNAPVLQDTYATPGGPVSTAPTIQMSEFFLTRRKGLIEFDLSGIPYGSKIMSADFIFEGQAASGTTVQRTFEIKYTPFSLNTRHSPGAR
jgi:hypothetical protein